jgi:hypothetical protein
MGKATTGTLTQTETNTQERTTADTIIGVSVTMETLNWKLTMSKCELCRLHLMQTVCSQFVPHREQSAFSLLKFKLVNAVNPVQN